MARPFRYDFAMGPTDLFRPTRVVQRLLIVLALTFLVQLWLEHFYGRSVADWFAMNRGFLAGPYPWQPLTYIFMHGSFLHLVLNLLGLYLLGRDVERALGPQHFILLFLATGALAGLGWLAYDMVAESFGGARAGYCIGASGAVLGSIGAYVALFPDRRLTPIFFPFISFRARTLFYVIAGISLYFALMPGGGGVAHMAHFCGMMAGYLYVRRLLRAVAVTQGTPRTAAQARIMDFPPSRARRMPSGEDDVAPTEAEINRILDKISAEGIGSLTRDERRKLDRASRGA